MRFPTAILFVSLLSACTSQTESAPEAVNAEPAPTTSINVQSALEQPVPALLGWVPDQACNFIGESFGVEVRSYEKEYEDEYSCSTPYKTLQGGANLPNNLAYYVTGKRDVATEVKLVLNINESSKQAHAKSQLEKFSSVVAKAATGTDLPPDMSSAITNGIPNFHEAAGFRQELKRDNWPTGEGYELHYVVTRVGEG